MRLLRSFSTKPTSLDRPLPFVYLGTVPYQNALNLQHQLVQRRLNALARGQDVYNPDQGLTDVVLLLQHTPVFTSGRRIKGTEDTEGKRLKAIGADYYEVQRGGQTTFHGPGQIVGYPILYLKDRGLSVRQYVEKLEQVMISTCAKYDISATTTENTGVWVNDAKIGAIGVQASRFVTSHGFALNCDTDLSWYRHIVPCGLPDKSVTSISKELKRNVTVDEALPKLQEAIQQVFENKLISLQSHSPKLNNMIKDWLQAAGTQA